METIAVARRLWIDAPPERVWKALTDPVQIQRWFSPTTPWELTSLEVGGKLYAVGYESQAGVIEIIDPPRQFGYRWTSEPPELPLTTLTTYLLEVSKGGTLVSLTETVSETLPEDARQRRIEDTGKGYKMALKNLKAYLEGTALPFPDGL